MPLFSQIKQSFSATKTIALAAFLSISVLSYGQNGILAIGGRALLKNSKAKGISITLIKDGQKLNKVEITGNFAIDLDFGEEENNLLLPCVRMLRLFGFVLVVFL